MPDPDKREEKMEGNAMHAVKREMLVAQRRDTNEMAWCGPFDPCLGRKGKGEEKGAPSQKSNILERKRIACSGG